MLVLALASKLERSELVDLLISRPFSSRRLVAADGGYQHFQRLGLSVDYLVGDFDSLTQDFLNSLHPQMKIERYPREKNESDGELAFAKALELGFDRLLVLAGLGPGRLDHTLCNLAMILEIRRRHLRAEILMTDGRQLLIPVVCDERSSHYTLDIAAFYPVFHSLHGRDEFTLSIVAMSDLIELEVSGLVYSLEKTNLPRYSSRTLSNVCKASNRRLDISCQSGEFLLILNPEDPLHPCSDHDSSFIEEGSYG
ncbi:MAG: thiamine diphosphokinase [Eubacteriales bacterium]|nr:thiamine diphosphokinase [Eubacteriales bacterium]